MSFDENWQEWFDKLGHKKIKVGVDYGQESFTVEEMYRMFRARDYNELTEELGLDSTPEV
jgi:hypothetical protein